MNSHITIPKCIYKEFALDNNGYYKYCVDTQEILRAYPKTTFTEEDYYSEGTEKYLSNAVERRLHELIVFGSELLSASDCIEFSSEINDIALTYAISLYARSPLLHQKAMSGIFAQFLPERKGHDFCVHYVMNDKEDEPFAEFDLHYIVNKTNTPFVLGSRGLFGYATRGVMFQISPISPRFGLLFVAKNAMPYGIGKQKITIVPEGDDDEIMSINNIIFVQQRETGGGCVVCHNRAILEKLKEDNQKDN